MTKTAPKTAIALALLALVACGGNKGLLGKRNAPDELLAGRQAPLVIPPDYNLTPPAPGTPRPLAPDARQEAVQALFPEVAPEPPKSEGETALLEAAGALRNTDATARSTVSDPGTVVVNKGSFVRELIGSPAGGNRQVAQVSVGPA